MCAMLMPCQNENCVLCCLWYTIHDVKGFLPSRQLRRHHMSSVFDDDANLYTFY